MLITFTQSNPDSKAKEEWEKMEIIERYNDHQRRYKNMTKDGVNYRLFYCNYDNCNDNHVKTTTTDKPKTTKPTTKKPSSSSAIASISLPLLMLAILSSILVL